MSNKCNESFTSQYAFFENKENIHIKKYIDDDIKCKLFCNNGHELLCVKGDKNIHHFRHKNKDDVSGNPMTKWHTEWQGNFPITEIKYLKINDTQITNRRADAVLEEHNLIIEFQHSKIEEIEVNNRKHDYLLHNKNIVWIIDGNKNILVKSLDYSKRVYLEFTEGLWKYKSFINYPYIYINIDNYIYKIYPSNVKSNMIDVQQPQNKQDFILALKDNKDLWHNEEPYQCRLFIKQQGAGNGKTYGIIQMLEHQDFDHYKSLIIVSKQHSAKYVIYNEFKSQVENKKLNYLKIISAEEINKKYVIKYVNEKTNKNCQIIIGTIDSLMFSIGNKNHTELDKFEGLVNSIIDGYINTSQSGTIQYGGLRPNLNKETCLIIDETQDLTQNYAKSIIQIMKNRYIDSYIVGDKLQSISYEKNAFTYLLDNEFYNINKIIYPFTNICRRFSHPKLIDFVNNIIPFDKYNLNKIESCQTEININDSVSPIIIFGGKSIYCNEKTDSNTINKEVENIMKYYEIEVNDNNCIPEDFLIITPFTNRNPLIEALQLKINMFWREKYTTDKFNRYAIFHKSEAGSSINLGESEKSTRIVSIHSSKGDGRKIVFVIGLNEGSLERFSGFTNNLIYDSLLHVALTRMKEKIYIRLENNGDDIFQKLQTYAIENNIKPKIYKLTNKFKYNDIISFANSNINKYFNFLKINMINEIKLIPLVEILDEKQVIDMGHHNIRYASLLINIYLEIIANENKMQTNNVKKQLKAHIYNVLKSELITTNNFKIYNECLWNNTNKSKKTEDKNIKENTINKNPDIDIINLCILQISNQGKDYILYYKIIESYIIKIKDKLNKYINKDISLRLCPLESIIFYYMIETCNNGIYTNINIIEIYNIIDIYNNSYNDSLKGHKKCLCKNTFKKKDEDVIDNNNITNMKNYLITHYEKVIKIKEIYNIFINKYPNINWNINHKLSYQGENKNFECYKKSVLTGYNEDNVFIAYIKPQLNTLNYNEILINSIFDTYLINNIDNETNNYNKYKNKNIITIIFTPDCDEPYYINWINNDNINLIEKHKKYIIDILQNKLFNEYLIKSKCIFSYYKYYRENCPDKYNKSALINIEYIISQYEEEKNENSPKYITEFFNNIKFTIEQCKDKHSKNNILKKYDDKEYFMLELEKRLKNSINRYLGIEDDDENSEDREDKHESEDDKEDKEDEEDEKNEITDEEDYYYDYNNDYNYENEDN
jgi:hypothetical protein